MYYVKKACHPVYGIPLGYIRGPVKGRGWYTCKRKGLREKNKCEQRGQDVGIDLIDTVDHRPVYCMVGFWTLMLIREESVAYMQESRQRHCLCIHTTLYSRSLKKVSFKKSGSECAG